VHERADDIEPAFHPVAVFRDMLLAPLRQPGYLKAIPDVICQL